MVEGNNYRKFPRRTIKQKYLRGARGAREARHIRQENEAEKRKWAMSPVALAAHFS
jgi:regulator of protease activity HflC (stomatin/prohibitin superfamily)